MPYAFVKDHPAALEYYRDVLGFTIDWDHSWDENGSSGSLARLNRDGIAIEIWTCQCPDGAHIGRAYFRLDVGEDIDGLYAEFVEKDVKIFCPPREPAVGGP